MALVQRQHCIALLAPSKLSSPRSSVRSTNSSGSMSSHSSISSSNYSFDHASSGQTSPSSSASSPYCFGPSKTRASCLSEFCSDRDNYLCTLSRRSPIRRRPKTRVVVRPLPPVPPPHVRPLPCPTTPRKLPSLPPSPPQLQQSSQQHLLHHEPMKIETNPTVLRKKPVTYDIQPEIDWDAIMVEMVRRSKNCDTCDADSIYTYLGYDEW